MKPTAMLAFAVALTALLSLAKPRAAVAAPPLVDPYLTSGKLADGETALTDHLAKKPDDDQARFGLGVLQFLRGVERVVQTLHAHGLKSQEGGLVGAVPILRLPTPPNENPKVIAYEDAQGLLRQFLADLGKAEATLAGVKDLKGLKMPLRFGHVRLDLDGDGTAGEDETLAKVAARVMRDADLDAPDAEQFSVVLDGGDAVWLRGYCHLLSAFCEVALAHDGRELFERTAHLFFPKVNGPYDFLQSGPRVADFGGGDIADVIALVHLIRLPVTEPDRMRAAHGHLREVVSLSRESWTLILAETDDDREWIPGPRQASVLAGTRVSKPMIDSWLAFLDETDALLAGRRLAPFWRTNDGRGVNLQRVFTEPTTLDLVLWVQGTAAAPYLEKGELTRPEVWRDLQRAFGGNLLGFAAWFN